MVGYSLDNTPSISCPMANTIVLVVLPLLIAVSTAAVLTVSIDADNGTNTSDCVTGNHSCRTLQYAVTHSDNDTNFLLLSDVTISTVVNFTSRHNISITGAAGQSKQILCHCNYSEQEPCGLVFENIENLTLENITVKHCGIPMNASMERENIVIRGGLIIKNGTGSTSLVRFNASENNGYGTVILNTGGTVSVYNSSFCYNNISNSYFSKEIGGGGLAIIVSCNHTDSTCSLSGNTYKISKSNFHNNVIRWENNSFSYLKLAHGGGLIVELGSNTAGNKLLISNSTFNNNSALRGGGLYVGMNSSTSLITIQGSIFDNNTATKGSGLIIICDDHCVDNAVNIKSSQFKNNKYYRHESYYNQGGGGIAILIGGGMPDGNNFTLHNCTFIRNRAWFGGGSYVYCGQQENNTVLLNEVHFTNCTWKHNIASLSPAVDVSPGYVLVSQTQYIVNVIFTDCIFLDNRVKQYHYIFDNNSQSLQTMMQYTGAFLAIQVPVTFAGHIRFINNNGTALLASSSIITFRKGSNVLFSHNSGVFGGAVNLVGFSLLQYQDDTSFHFVTNNATYGGAINVRSFDQHLTYVSQTCFLSPWEHKKPENVTLEFLNNTATTGVGNAIYMTSVEACLRSCKYILQNKKLFAAEVFENNSCLGNFNINSTAHCNTEGTQVSVKTVEVMPLRIIPGKHYKLPLNVLDEFSNDVTNVTVYTAQLADSCFSLNVSIDPAFTNVASNIIRILGMPNVTCDLLLTIHGSQMIQVSVQFSLTWCHPGYVLHYQSNLDSYSCTCSASLRHKHYNGIDSCDGTTFAAIINPGIWVGYDDQADPIPEKLYTAPCPASYCNPLSELNMPPESLQERMCKKNRHEFLCGECRNKTSIFFNSFYPTCKEDHNCMLGPLFYIVFELLPISVVFIVIILANISLTSGVAYNAIFLAQILSTLSFVANGAHGFPPLKYIDFVYGIVDLNFNFPTFCLWSGANALQIKAMKYVSLLYAMGLVVVTITVVNHCNCSARLSCRFCHRIMPRQFSIVQGLIAFVVICYSQCARTSFQILTVARVLGMGKNWSKNVVFYDGSISYFSREHLPYAIPAVFMLIIVVAPLPLVLLFDPFLLKVEGRLVQHGLLKPCLLWTLFRMKFKPFLDSFQGCFRDDTRYFAGLFFFYRVVIYITSMMAKNTFEFNIYLEAILIVMLTIQATFQPFENKFDNILSCCMFTVLLLMNTLTIRVYSLLQSGGDEEDIHVLVITWFQTVLACIPILVGLCMCAKWLVMKIKLVRAKETSTNHEESLLLNRNFSGSYSPMVNRAGVVP